MCDAGLVGQTGIAIFFGRQRNIDDEGARQKSIDYTQEKVSTWMLKKLGWVTLLSTVDAQTTAEKIAKKRSFEPPKKPKSSRQVAKQKEGFQVGFPVQKNSNQKKASRKNKTGRK